MTYDPYSIPFLEPKAKQHTLPLVLETKAGKFEFRLDDSLPDRVSVSGNLAHQEILRLLAVVKTLGAQCDKQARRINQLCTELEEIEKSALFTSGGRNAEVHPLPATKTAE